MELDVHGARAYVYTAGHSIDPARPTVVFIHGGEQDHAAWALQSRYFAYHGHNVLAPDLPGHGRSRGSPLASIEALAGWIAGLLDAAGIARASIVGQSMGSLAALEFAARERARTTKLVLLGASAPMPVAQSLLDAARADDHAALDMINIWSHSSRARLGGNTAPGMWMLGANLRLMERQAPGVLYADFKACNDYTYGADAAARVECPTLIVIGSHDQMTPPRASLELLQTIPHARSVTLDGSGHSLMAEAPDAVLDALIGFLQPAAQA
jgi:pimeloyl-ACP methyl ester carboxylesterase